MKQIRRFIRFMNPSVDPKVTEDMDRRSLRNIHVISWIVLFFELAAFIAFVFSRLGNYNREAFISTVTVSFSISLCALAAFLSERMLKAQRLPHTWFFFFKLAVFVAFFAAAIVVDFRHYRAGDQMLTFYAVNLVIICFILFRPWVGALLIIGAFLGLLVPIWLYNRAADIEVLNFIVLALASVATNAIRYHTQVNISSKTIQLTEANAALENASRRDGLTGLLNRLALEEDAGNTDGRRMTAYMVDVNYFKEFNDRHGHAAGDAVLRAVSETLEHLYPGGHYYRYGGDEFLVLTYKSPADNYGSDTFDLTEEKFGLKVLLSIGNAQGSPESYEDLFDLISRADKALYVTKQRTHSAEFGGHDRRKNRN